MLWQRWLLKVKNSRISMSLIQSLQELMHSNPRAQTLPSTQYTPHPVTPQSGVLYQQGPNPQALHSDTEGMPNTGFYGLAVPLLKMLHKSDPQFIPDYFDANGKNFIQSGTEDNPINTPIDRFGNTQSMYSSGQDLEMNPNIGPGSRNYNFQHVIPLNNPTGKKRPPITSQI